MGKKNISEHGHKNVKFNQGHMSFVGFFNHNKKHNNYAYEIFNSDGPWLYYQPQIVRINQHLLILQK